MKSESYVLGLDLGGTHLKVIAVTPKGEQLEFITAPTDGSDWAETVRAIVRELTGRLGLLLGIGVAAPGLAAPNERSIAQMPGRLPGLEGLDWTSFLGASSPVYVVNDAHAALLGEIWQGAALNERNVFLLTLGTGVGGAAVVDGNLLHGHLGRAGHLGHISLDPRGPADIIKTPGSLEEAVGNATIGRRSQGRYTSMLSLAEDVRLGQPDACKLWQRMIEDLAAAIASLINVLDPAVVLIGGGISEAGDLLFIPLQTQLAYFEWRPTGRGVRLVRAQLGNRAGAFGAAWLALKKQNLFE